MSGVAGADRVKSRQDFAQFLKDYQKVLAKFPGFQSMKPSGSYNSNLEKQDFGDIDLIVHITSDKDKATVKKELQAFFTRMPDTVIVPFSSEKHAGKRTYNAGELVSVRYHDDTLGYSAQIDNIVALDQSEADFKQQFLDLPAEKQGLILGLTKIATIESDPQTLFKKLGISAPPLSEKNQEYEFNLSSVEIQLRKVTYKPGTYEQVGREVIWTSRDFNDLRKVLYQYNLDADFDQLLAQSKQTIHNPRSSNRMQGVFSSMISVKSGEVGTAKGAGKEAALGKVKQTFGEGRSRLLNELVKPKDRTVAFAFGRFQPPTIGHKLLIGAVQHAAQAAGADTVIYVSRTQDHKANPLSVDQKIHYLKKMFPGVNFIAADDQVRTPVEAVKHLNGKYNNLIMVAGADRAAPFQELLNKYNGVEFNYNTAKVISSGDRDPDSDGAEGMSGTKMRAAAVENNFSAFRQGLPSTLSDKDAQELMLAVQAGLVKPARKTPVKKVAPVEDASGVIATKAQAKDPRYSMSLTKDVRPGQIEKNLKAFSLEAMLPKSAFAGSDKNKLGTAGQLRNQKRGARAGDLVGGDSIQNDDKPLEDQRLDPKCWKGYRKSGTKMKGGTKVNNCVKIGEGWENQISNLVNLLEKKQLNELMTYAGNKGYESAGAYKRYDLFVSKKKFNNIAFIAVAENPRDKRVVHKGQGNTQEDALADIRVKIDKEIDVAQKVSGQATIDFNVDFVREILEMSSDRFYAKIIPGPKLVIAGKEMEQYPEIMQDEGFKGSTIRNDRDSEGSTKLPGIPLNSKSAAASKLIANGRYVLGSETIDRDGNRVFDLEFDSVVADKGERMRMRAPAFTVGTNR